MTEAQRQRILQKAREHALDTSKIDPDFKIAGDPWANDSLAKVIKTKEQADFLMVQLEWQRNKANNK